MEGDVQLSAATLVEQLARIEQAQKRLGLVNHGYGVRLAIAEVQRLAGAARPAKSPPCPSDVPVSQMKL